MLQDPPRKLYRALRTTQQGELAVVGWMSGWRYDIWVSAAVSTARIISSANDFNLLVFANSDATHQIIPVDTHEERMILV